jgi:hypothetical protein
MKNDLIREWTFLERLACARRWINRITDCNRPLPIRSGYIRFIRLHNPEIYRIMEFLIIRDEVMLFLANDLHGRN